MRAPPLTLLCALAVGCGGYKHEDFAVAFAANTCELYETCDVLTTTMGFDDLDDCLGTLEDKVDPARGNCPEYDDEIGFSCIEAIAALSCEDALAGAWPAQCDQTCPDGAAGKPEPEGEDEESDEG